MEKNPSLETLDSLKWQFDIGVDECINETPILAPLTKAQDFAVAAPITITPKAQTTLKQNVTNVAPISFDDISSLADFESHLKTNKELCSLQKISNLIFASGNPDADVMIIADMPALEADKMQTFFSKNEELLFNNLLTSLKIDAQSFYLTYAINWRAPGDLMPNDEIVKVCQQVIYKHISIKKPRLIIALGQNTLKVLNINDKVGGEHQLMIAGASYPIISTYSLSYVLQIPLAKSLLYKSFINIKKAI